MKNQLLAIATGLCLSAAGLMGQGDTPVLQMGANFQQAGTIGQPVTLPIQIFPFGAPTGAPITGSPFSARQVNKTVQTLSDGTELENTQTTLIYRDSQGRTRTEPVGTGGPILIADPVAGVRITLLPDTKTARRVAAPGLVAAGRGGTVNTPAEIDALRSTLVDAVKAQAARGPAQSSKNQTVVENLGFQNQNGVLAEGTRSTLTIPAGQIGNNRDIKVVNERWYSKDLQMIVKSVNSDPRFGVTTHELTNIVQSADPAMFQIPADYTITEGPGRGGRGR